MPLYEFKCCKCGWVHETVVSLSVLPEGHENIQVKDVSCPKCQGVKFDRLISMHGKTVLNWASWQDKPSVPKAPKKTGPKKPPAPKK